MPAQPYLIPANDTQTNSKQTSKAGLCSFIIKPNFRVNPLFQDDDPYITSTRQGSSKNCELYRTSSYSSGYGSSIGGQETENLGLSYIRRNGKTHKDSLGRTRKPETGAERSTKALVPSPIWPGVGSGTLPRKNVDIMKERFYMNKINQNFDSKRNSYKQGDIQSWLQFDEINQSNKSNTISDRLINSKSPECEEIVENQKPRHEHGTGSAEHDSIVTNALLAMTGQDNTAESDEDQEEEYQTYRQDDMEKVIKQLTEAVSKSRGVSSLSKAVARSRKQKDVRKLNKNITGSFSSKQMKSLKSQQKFQKAPVGLSNLSYDSDSSCESMDGKEASMDASQMTDDKRLISHATLPLSARKLSDQLSRHSSYRHSYGRHGHHISPRTTPDPLQHVRQAPSSSSWLLARRDSLAPSYYPYTQFRHGGEVWGEDRWRHPHFVAGIIGESGEEKKKSKSMVLFLKSFCFLLLLTSFVMVIVTVSVFLSKGGKRFVQM